MTARIGELLEYKRVTTEGIHSSEAQVDLGGGNIVTATHYSIPGDDSLPLVGEFALCTQVGSEWYVIGFIDQDFAPIAQSGERVLTSRSALGTVEAKLHLKADGTTEVNGTDPVAMSPLVADELNRIKDDIQLLKDQTYTAVNAVGVGMAANGPTAATAFQAATASIPSTPGNVASTRLFTE